MDENVERWEAMRRFVHELYCMDSGDVQEWRNGGVENKKKG